MSDRELYAIVQTDKNTGESSKSDYIYSLKDAARLARDMEKSSFFNPGNQFRFTIVRAM